MQHFTITPGDPQSTVIIHVPHAGLGIPDDARRSIVLNDEALATEAALMADTNTDVLARRAYELTQVAPHLFINNFSRLTIDPERFDSPAEEMNKVGMGVVYTKTHDGQVLRVEDSDREMLVAKYFDSYSSAFTQLVNNVLAAHGRATIIDVHSYAKDPLPYELHKDDERPQLCIGYDTHHTTNDLANKAVDSFSHFDFIAVNEPFQGSYVPLEHYKKERQLESVMLELRKDAYDSNNPESELFNLAIQGIVRLIQLVN